MADHSQRGTILHRISSALRRQDWTAVVVEIAIVFVGVLLGTQVSNWNDTRKEQAEVAALLERLKPELRQGMIEGPAFAGYFASRSALGEKAERLLMEGGDDFGLVTSARLSGSYAWVVDFDRDTYVMKLGADTMSRIPSGTLRNALADLIELNNDPYVRYSYLDTDFRRLVLRLYPAGIGVKIARDCNLVGVDDPTISQLRSVSTTECASDLPPGRLRGRQPRGPGRDGRADLRHVGALTTAGQVIKTDKRCQGQCLFSDPFGVHSMLLADIQQLDLEHQ